jgi:hypothetical protein
VIIIHERQESRGYPPITRVEHEIILVSKKTGGEKHDHLWQKYCDKLITIDFRQNNASFFRNSLYLVFIIFSILQTCLTILTISLFFIHYWSHDVMKMRECCWLNSKVHYESISLYSSRFFFSPNVDHSNTIRTPKS